jgi:hypothetical protein
VIKKKGHFKAFKENTKAYVELRGKIKSAKAQLAKLDESTGGEVGTSKKSKKLLQQTTKLLQHCKLKSRLNLAQPRRPQQKPRARLIRLPVTCSSCMQICCQLMQNSHGTR